MGRLRRARQGETECRDRAIGSAHPFKPILVHLAEQRLERAEVGVADEFVAGQALAEQVVLADAGLHAAGVDEVGQLHGGAALAGAYNHPLMVAVKLAEQRVHGASASLRSRAPPSAHARLRPR